MSTRGNLCVFPRLFPGDSEDRLSANRFADPAFGSDTPTARPRVGDSSDTYQIPYDTRLRRESNGHGIRKRALTGCEPLARAIPSDIDRSGFQ